MNKTVKRIIIGVLITALVGGGVWGGPVGVAQVSSG